MSETVIVSGYAQIRGNPPQKMRPTWLSSGKTEKTQLIQIDFPTREGTLETFPTLVSNMQTFEKYVDRQIEKRARGEHKIEIVATVRADYPDRPIMFAYWDAWQQRWTWPIQKSPYNYSGVLQKALQMAKDGLAR